MKKLLVLFMFIVGCGDQAYEAPPLAPEKSPEQKQLEHFEQQLIYLQGTITQINNMVSSDFATCKTGSGDASDALINKICKVAQASTVEAKVEMKEELQTFSNVIQEKLDYVTDDLTDVIDDLDGINFSQMATDISNLQTSVGTLETNMTNAQSAITALQTLTNSINGTLNGTVFEVQVGSENVAAGPVYESLLKRTDGAKITGYIEAFDTAVNISNDGVATTSGSAVLTITAAAVHSLSTGDRVLLADIKKGKGWSSSEVNGEFTVTVTSTTVFTITLPRNSTKTGSFGGNAPAKLQKVLGKGLGLIWQISDGSDTVVRVGNPRGTPYNFMIIKDGSDVGFVCYDKTVPLQTNTNILNASCQTAGVATGNCVCK